MPDTPTRTPYRLAANGIAATIRAHDLDRIDLGIAALKLDLAHAGWPARSPTDDRSERKPRITHTCACGQGFPSHDTWTWHRDETGHTAYTEAPSPETSALDYADPTGDLGTSTDRHHRDLERIQDIHHTIAHQLRALEAIIKPYVPTATAEPACSRHDCDATAERNSNGNGYRGCVLVAGIWCAIPGARIRCRRCRAADERKEREEADARAEAQSGTAA